MIIRRRRLRAGELLGQTMLHTHAVYKVVGRGMGFGYILECVSVPGLLPGTRVRVSKNATERMEILSREQARGLIYPQRLVYT